MSVFQSFRKLAVLATLLLALRSLAPDGYMLQADDGYLAIELCGDNANITHIVWFNPETGDYESERPGVPSDNGHSEPCSWSTLTSLDLASMVAPQMVRDLGWKVNNIPFQHIRAVLAQRRTLPPARGPPALI